MGKCIGGGRRAPRAMEPEICICNEDELSSADMDQSLAEEGDEQ
jgi:hypothetical protein